VTPAAALSVLGGSVFSLFGTCIFSFGVKPFTHFISAERAFRFPETPVFLADKDFDRIVDVSDP